MKWLRGAIWGSLLPPLLLLLDKQRRMQRPPQMLEGGRANAQRRRKRERESRARLYLPWCISPREAAAVCLRCPYPEAALSIRHTCPLIRRWHTRCFIHRTPPPPLIQPPLSLSRNLTPCIKSPNTQNLSHPPRDAHTRTYSAFDSYKTGSPPAHSHA